MILPLSSLHFYGLDLDNDSLWRELILAGDQEEI